MAFFEDVVNNGPAGENSGFAKTLFVGSATANYQSAAAGDTYDNPAPTLLSIVRSGVLDTADRGTRVVVRKGHTESVSVADYLTLLGARKRVLIVGEGDGVDRPAFTWTAAGSTLLMDTDSLILRNLRLFLAGPHAAGTAVTVAAPITISGAGCKIQKCQIFGGFDADQIVTIGVTTTAAATDLAIEDCDFIGETAAECTTMIQFVGASRLKFLRNTVRCATSAVSVGVVRFLTTASTDIQIYDCTLQHKKAASETALTGMAGNTGQMDRTHLCVLANGAGQLVIGGANSAFLLPASVQCGPFVSVTNDIAERAALMTPISA